MKAPDVSSGKKFAIILTHHRLWGQIFLPYIIVNEANSNYFALSECLSPFYSEETISSLKDEEREVLRIIIEYSDRSLFKLFSKDKSVKDFLQNVKTERIEKFIRPYIEQRIRKCFSIARDEGIACFHKKNNSSILHSSDRIHLVDEKAKPLFIFNRSSSGSTYKLKIEVEGKPVELFRNPVKILSNSPCIIMEGYRIFSIEDIDSSKLKPFLIRDYVIIPKNSEIKYFSGFVLNTVNSYKVEGTGFSIIEEEPVKSPCLDLEIGIKGLPVLILSFSYSGLIIFPDDRSTWLTEFIHSDGYFSYRKYRRNPGWEDICIRTLEDMGFTTDDNIVFYIREQKSTESSLDTMIEAINRNYIELSEAGFTIDSAKLGRKYNLRPVNIEIISTMADDWFDLRAIIRIAEWEIPFIKFRHNILERIREYELPDGTVAILPEEWFAKYRSILEFGKEKGGILHIHKQHFSILSEILDNKETEGYKQVERLMDTEALPVVSVPSGMTCSMRKYQVEGLTWLYWLQSSGFGGCLADDMGLGKTIQTLALLQLNNEILSPINRQSNKYQTLTLFDIPACKFTSLIIVPATLIYNWENEIKKFFPGMKTYCHKGIQRIRSVSSFDNYDIVLSSYHTVRQDIDLLSSYEFHYIILDESQVIKNPGSMIYKSVVKLKSDHKLVLTGTPVENSLIDLWAQLNFINPGLLGSLAFFRRDYAKPIEKLGDNEKEMKLRQLIKPFILRRTKEMVAKDLPPVVIQTVYCDMTEEQEKIYEEEKSLVRNVILGKISQDGIEKSSIFILQGLMKLRQISNHPVMADDEYTAGSGKFDSVLNDIENVVTEGHKILVFSSFVMHLKLFASALEKKSIKFTMLTGSSINRDQLVDKFQGESSNKVFLISLKTGGVGLNLTAADYVFILDPWWNPAAEMQALSRAHRIGQDKNVFVCRYISKGTLEEKIVRLQEKKSRLAESFIQSNNPLTEFDMQQILEIIE